MGLSNNKVESWIFIRKPTWKKLAIAGGGALPIALPKL
jgi:hypothetical protein